MLDDMLDAMSDDMSDDMIDDGLVMFWGREDQLGGFERQLGRGGVIQEHHETTFPQHADVMQLPPFPVMDLVLMLLLVAVCLLLLLLVLLLVLVL
jgi:hypothetical protein